MDIKKYGLSKEDEMILDSILDTLLSFEDIEEQMDYVDCLDLSSNFKGDYDNKIIDQIDEDLRELV